MPRWMHRFLAALAGLAIAWPLAAGPAQAPGASSASMAVPPAGLRGAGRTQARREQCPARRTTQPGNNAPFWRAVKDQQGYTSLPGQPRRAC